MVTREQAMGVMTERARGRSLSPVSVFFSLMSVLLAVHLAVDHADEDLTVRIKVSSSSPSYSYMYSSSLHSDGFHLVRFALAVCPALPPSVINSVTVKNVNTGVQHATAWALSTSMLSFAFPPGYQYPSVCSDLSTFQHSLISRYERFSAAGPNADGDDGEEAGVFYNLSATTTTPIGNCTGRYDRKISWVDLNGPDEGCAYRYIRQGSRSIVNINVQCAAGGGILSPLNKQSLFSQQFDFTTLWLGSSMHCQALLPYLLDVTVPLTYPLVSGGAVVVMLGNNTARTTDAVSDGAANSNGDEKQPEEEGSSYPPPRPSPPPSAFIPPFDPNNNEGGFAYRRQYPSCGSYWGDALIRKNAAARRKKEQRPLSSSSPLTMRTNTNTFQTERGAEAAAQQGLAAMKEEEDKKEKKGASAAASVHIVKKETTVGAHNAAPKADRKHHHSDHKEEAAQRQQQQHTVSDDQLFIMYREAVLSVLITGDGSASAAAAAAAKTRASSEAAKEEAQNDATKGKRFGGHSGSGNVVADAPMHAYDALLTPLQKQRLGRLLLGGGRGGGAGGRGGGGIAAQKQAAMGSDQLLPVPLMTAEVLVDVISVAARHNRLVSALEKKRRKAKAKGETLGFFAGGGGDGDSGSGDGLTPFPATPHVREYGAAMFLCTNACGLAMGDVLSTLQRLVAFNQAVMVNQYMNLPEPQYSPDKPREPYSPLVVQPPISNLIYDAFTVVDGVGGKAAAIARFQTDVPLDVVLATVDCVGGQSSGFLQLTGAIRLWQGFRSYLPPFTSRNVTKPWDFNQQADVPAPNCTRRMQQLRSLISGSSSSSSSSSPTVPSSVDDFFTRVFLSEAFALNGFYIDLDPGSDCGHLITDADRDDYALFLRAFIRKAALLKGAGLLNIFVAVGAPVLSTPPSHYRARDGSVTPSNSSSSAAAFFDYTITPNLWTRHTVDRVKALAEVRRRVAWALAPVLVLDGNASSSSYLASHTQAESDINSATLGASGVGGDSEKGGGNRTYFMPQLVATDGSVVMRYLSKELIEVKGRGSSNVARRRGAAPSPSGITHVGKTRKMEADKGSDASNDDSTDDYADDDGAATYNTTHHFSEIVMNFTQPYSFVDGDEDGGDPTNTTTTVSILSPTSRQCAASYNGTTVYYLSSKSDNSPNTTLLNSENERESGGVGSSSPSPTSAADVLPIECLTRPRAYVGVSCWGGGTVSSSSSSPSSFSSDFDRFSSSSSSQQQRTHNHASSFTAPNDEVFSANINTSDFTTFFTVLREHNICNLFIDARDTVHPDGNAPWGYGISKTFLNLLLDHQTYCGWV